MTKTYCYSVVATKDGHILFTSGLQTADNDYEAKGKVYDFLYERFPVKDGYSNHGMNIFDITDGIIDIYNKFYE